MTILTVTKSGGGGGIVRSSPSGIYYGQTGSFDFVASSAPVLEAIPGEGSRFSGWTGAINDSAPEITVPLSAPETVDAAFEPSIPSSSSTSIYPYLNVLVSISRPDRVGDGQGGFTDNLKMIETSTARISPISSREREISEQRRAEISHHAFLPVSSAIRRDDILDNGSRTFRVVGVRLVSDGNHLEADLIQIERGA